MCVLVFEGKVYLNYFSIPHFAYHIGVLYVAVRLNIYLLSE